MDNAKFRHIISFVLVVIFTINDVFAAEPAPKGVDLGLSVEWATCNVGASDPSDPGVFYPGGTLTGIDGGWGKISPEMLKLRKTWSEEWSLPSEAELKELTSKCKWEKARLNGISGYKITGPNGNYIFVPLVESSEPDSQKPVAAIPGEYAFYWCKGSGVPSFAVNKFGGLKQGENLCFHGINPSDAESEAIIKLSQYNKGDIALGAAEKFDLQMKAGQYRAFGCIRFVRKRTR